MVYVSDEREQINNFLTKSLNLLTSAEEITFEKMFKGQVSVKEVHLIETIGNCEKTGNNTAGEIAKAMGVTLGTLTVTAGTLTKKGLVDRIKADLDKRVVRLALTPAGYDIYKKNLAFRKKLAIDVLKNLTKDEQVTLIDAIHIIEKYFNY